MFTSAHSSSSLPSTHFCVRSEERCETISRNAHRVTCMQTHVRHCAQLNEDPLLIPVVKTSTGYLYSPRDISQVPPSGQTLHFDLCDWISKTSNTLTLRTAFSTNLDFDASYFWHRACLVSPQCFVRHQTHACLVELTAHRIWLQIWKS